MKIGVKYASHFDFVALRTLLGTLCLFIVMLCLRKPIRPKEVPGTFLLGLLQTTGLLGLITWALVSGGAGKTSVLAYTMPFWVLFLAWPILGERIRGLQWIAIILALAGLVLVIGPLNLNSGLVSDGLAILSGVFWAMSTIVVKKLRNQADLDLLSLTAWQMLFGTIPLVVVALFLHSKPIVWSTDFIVALIYTGIAGAAVVWPLWLYLLSKLSAGVASMATLATPIIGVLSAWIQLGERPGFTESIGMLLIGIALVLISLQSFKQGKSHG